MFSSNGTDTDTKGNIMNFLDDLKKRRAYNRTLNELRRLPLDVALDLDIYHGDAEKLARRAVYGL
jgi:hypothetical protein